MAIEYNYNSKDMRIQIDYIQIFPARQEVYIAGVYFDKTKFDFKPFAQTMTPADLGAPAQATIVDLLTKTYTWFSNDNYIDDLIDLARDGTYVRPSTVIDAT